MALIIDPYCVIATSLRSSRLTNRFIVIARSETTKQPIVLASALCRAVPRRCRFMFWEREQWVASEALPPRNDNQILPQVS
jgi:hypothetical protein